METGNWKMEIGKWKLEIGKWRLETGKSKLENGKWRPEQGNWKMETGRAKVEVGGCAALKSEIRDLKSPPGASTSGAAGCQSPPGASTAGAVGCQSPPGASTAGAGWLPRGGHKGRPYKAIFPHLLPAGCILPSLRMQKGNAGQHGIACARQVLEQHQVALRIAFRSTLE